MTARRLVPSEPGLGLAVPGVGRGSGDVTCRPQYLNICDSSVLSALQFVCFLKLQGVVSTVSLSWRNSKRHGLSWPEQQRPPSLSAELPDIWALGRRRGHSP